MAVGAHQQSPFHIELNPWCTDEKLERSLLRRGAYVAAVGQVETHLTEWAIRSSRTTEYANLRAKFPRHRNERIGYLRNLAAAPGPLIAFAERVVDIVDRYESLNDLRDIFAHGSMTILAMRGVGGEASLNFKDYFGRGSNIEVRGTPMSLLQLEAEAIKATEAARIALALHLEVDRLLPAI